MTNRIDNSLVQADFDRLAAFSTERWDHNSHYHRFLLKHVPPHCRQVLELGCGTGTFARLLATRAQQVLALDLSPQMIHFDPLSASPTLLSNITWSEDQEAPAMALLSHLAENSGIMSTEGLHQ